MMIINSKIATILDGEIFRGIVVEFLNSGMVAVRIGENILELPSSRVIPIGAPRVYVTPNYPTKKELKAAVKNGKEVKVFNPGPFGAPTDNGIETVEGPHYPEPHTWCARVTLKDRIITKVS